MKSKLDRIDFEILEALQKNARLSNKEIAAHVGLAPSSALERVKRLRETGVLRGYRAIVDPQAIGIRLQALIAVRLQHHSRDVVETFQQHVLGLEETLETFHLAGRDDFLIHVAVRDADHLRNVVLDHFTAWPEVDHVETNLVYAHATAETSPIY